MSFGQTSHPLGTGGVSGSGVYFEVYPTNFLVHNMLSLWWVVQVLELQLPSFFNNFDPRAAAANFPPSNKLFVPN